MATNAHGLSVMPLCNIKKLMLDSSASPCTHAYEWTDHCVKASCSSRKDAQTSDRERNIVQACNEKEHAVREAGIAKKNRLDVQVQCERKLKKGGKDTCLKEEAKELEKAVIKLRTHWQVETKEGTIKDEEAEREASESGREISEVCASVSISTSESVIPFSRLLMQKD
jgi:hypothetical protein